MFINALAWQDSAVESCFAVEGMISLCIRPDNCWVMVVFVRGLISSANALSFLANSSRISSLLSGYLQVCKIRF